MSILAVLHPDLVAVTNVWGPDSRIDSLKAEHEGLVRAIKTAEAELLASQVQVTNSQTALETAQKVERANARELESYVQKRNDTRRMIETGTAPDYGAAERQLAGVLAKVDALETSGLECLDAVDTLSRALASAKAREGKATTELAASRSALSKRDAPIRAELGELLPKREAAWQALHPELKPTYADLRRKKKRVVVTVKDGACAVCYTLVPPQAWLDTQSAKEAHQCTGCGGWILPE